MMRRLVGSLTVAALAVSGVLGGGAASTAAVGPPEPAAPGSAVVTPPLTWEERWVANQRTGYSDVLQWDVAGRGPTNFGPTSLLRMDESPEEVRMTLPDDHAVRTELRLVPAVGDLQVGTTTRRNDSPFGQRHPFQVDLATGVGTWLPDPADAPGALALRGVWGSDLVWDTGKNQRPSGGVGLALQRLGGTALRRIPVPGLDPQVGTLDVLPDGRALVALGTPADGGHLALVTLATGAVQDLPFAPYRGGRGPGANGRDAPALAFATLVGDHLVYVDVTFGDPTLPATLHTCLLSTGGCTSLPYTLRKDLWATLPAVSARGVALPTAAGVLTGPWQAGGGVALSATPVPGVVAAAALSNGIVGYDPTSHRLLRLDPATGAATLAYTFPTVPGRFVDVRLDAGALVTQDKETGTTRRLLSGGRSVVTVAPPQPSDPLRPSQATSGVWAVTGFFGTSQVEVRDDGRLVGTVTAPGSGSISAVDGSTWVWSTHEEAVVYFGATRGPTLEPWPILDGPLALSRTAKTVTDLRTGTAVPARFDCDAPCRVMALIGPRVLLQEQTAVVNRVRQYGWRVVDWRTGTTVATGLLPRGTSIRGWDRDDLLLYIEQDPADFFSVGTVEVVRMPVDAGGEATHLILARRVGWPSGIGDGRVAWDRRNTPTTSIVVAPVPGPARPAVLRSVLAADAVTARTPWAFAADVDGALTSWRLTITHPDGTTAARLTGSAALGAVRTAWTPPAGAPAGRYTWTLTGRSAMGDAPVVDPLGEPVTGVIAVRLP